MNNIENIFKKIGGKFITPISELEAKVPKISAFLFDWDGVFNEGRKGGGTHSDFSEIDSMGLNMLRFGWWLATGKLPIFMVITGEQNPAAFQLAQRECWNAVYFKISDKRNALYHAQEHFGIQTAHTAFAFDDVLDLNVAQLVAFRCQIGRPNILLFSDFVQKNRFCDYVTSQSGGHHALREMSELLLALQGNFETVVRKRMEFKGDYENYLTERRKIRPLFFTYQNNEMQQVINELLYS
jgi:3-deoxy-D-manno-octulosonate 8-phosphate phosphatase (KDO 8-P phosphatase)